MRAHFSAFFVQAVHAASPNSKAGQEGAAVWNKAEARDRLQQRSGGCEGRVRRPFESELTGLESSVEYQRHELNEWYSNEGYGLERYFSEKQLSGTAREREPLVAISSG